MKITNKPDWIQEGRVVHMKSMMMLTTITIVGYREVYFSNGVCISVSADVKDPWDYITRFVSPASSADAKWFKGKIASLKEK